MNRLCITLCLGLALCLANLSSEIAPGGGGPGGAAGILMIEEVQKELSITDEQKAKLREAMTGQRSVFRNSKISVPTNARKKSLR